MVLNKKISSDILLLVLLVVRLRLDSEIGLFERYNRMPVSREVHLGSSSAYTQITFHAPYSNNRYVHPKNFEFYERDEATILFNRLNYFNSVRERRNNLLAYYASSPAVQNIETNIENTNSDATGGDDASGDASFPTVADSGCDNPGGTACDREASSTVINQDLSPEDMDLIEILWKQDIDMGVTRDAYDSRPGLEVEKLKDVEYTKETRDYMQELFVHDAKNENEVVSDPLAGLNYTVDSETGEFVLDDIPELKEEIPSENDTLALTQDSYLPFYDDASSLTSLADALPDLLSENYSDSLLLSHLEDFEKQLETFVPLDEENESLNYPQPPDGLNVIDDCWPESSMVLPLLNFSTNHQPQFVTPSPRQDISYSSGPSVSTPNPVQVGASDVFTNIHNPVLEAPTDEEPFHNIAVSVGPTATGGVTSIGCALAESFATLHNDPDPIPSSSVINTCNPELPELIYTNGSLATSQNVMLNDFFPETFQLMTLPSEVNHTMTTEDHVDISSDSASLASGHVPSVSDCPDWGDSCSEASSHNGENRSFSLTMSSGRGNSLNQNAELYHSSLSAKRQKHLDNSDARNRDYFDGSYEPASENGQYSPVKREYTDIYENRASGISNGYVHSQGKFDYSSRSSAINNDFLHHNHSYHLPVVNDESRYKPVLRDKTKCSEADSCNKDEKRAKELKLPISIDDIINLAIDEYNERLSKYELTDQQLTLIRDIRRRGKNKVAAQNCRKRKMDQITSLQDNLNALQKEKNQLKSKKNFLLQEKHCIEDKYVQLYQLVSQFTNCMPPGPSSNREIHNADMTVSTTSDIAMSDDDSDLSRGARTKRKLKK